MVQEEVADRIVARPGTSAYGALAVGVQSVATAERLFRVARGAFRPVPKVESAVVRITPLRPEPLVPAQEAHLRVLVRAAFQWRRKQLGKILRDHPDLALGGVRAMEVAEELGLNLSDRPERLDPPTFMRLAERIADAPAGS
jgi:16S rRNA (adenine1518-N6/adenine1519-N6)-dimethyltransferase